MILAVDDDPGRGSWSWQRTMILAENHDPGRCSCWKTMILLEYRKPSFKDDLGTTSGPFSAKSENHGQICCWKLGYTVAFIRLQNVGCHMKNYDFPAKKQCFSSALRTAQSQAWRKNVKDEKGRQRMKKDDKGRQRTKKDDKWRRGTINSTIKDDKGR